MASDMDKKFGYDLRRAKAIEFAFKWHEKIIDTVDEKVFDTTVETFYEELAIKDD